MTTASWLLERGRGEAADGLGRALGGLPLGPLSPDGFTALRERLTDIVYDLLKLDLGELIAGGWRLHASLTDAARATVYHPGATELVELATHAVSVSHRPSVDILVNGAAAATLTLELSVQIEIHGVIGTVRQGRLVELQVAAAQATGNLSCQAIRLVTGSARLDPAFVIGLGRGLVLIPEADARPTDADEPGTLYRSHTGTA